MIVPEIISEIIAELGSNYQEDSEVLTSIYSDMASIASNISNISADDEVLHPYIKKAVKAEYLARGAEGLKSRSEGSISSTYESIRETLRNDLIQSGLRRVF